MLFNHNINNLSGGVSQQSEEARYDTQVEEMINFVPTVAQGLRRRNPIEYRNALAITYQDNMAIHSYSRGDGVETYGMILDNNGLKVFDVSNDMTNIPVTDFGTAGNTVIEQWAGTDWENDIQFLTVGDTTWILNTSIVTATTGDLTPTDDTSNSAFYWIKKSYDDGSGHGYAYQIVLNNVKFNAVYPDTTVYDAWGVDVPTRKANWGFSFDAANVGLTFNDSLLAATALARYIDVYATTNYTARAEGSIVYITRTAPFTFESGDSWGNQASTGWTDSLAKIADLPASMDGFTNAEVGTIAITGTDKDTFTNYYLEWDTDHWKETVKEGIEYKINHMTMPAKLVRQSDTSFALGWNIENPSYDGFATIWEERDKGDDDSNPIPSFIGSKLSNMFFLKNRLCFTSEENVIMSKIGSYYNFFATTVMEVLDNDPIDAAADSNNISVIRAVNVTGGAVTLWTDTAQFILTGGETLSPTTTRISQTSSYVADTSIPPINVDNEVIFFNKKGNWLEALTYSPSTFNNDNSTAGSISSHIPAYLPSTINHVEVSQSENLILMLNPLEHNYIYCYKYHIHNNERTMSAWFKWEFPVAIKKINVLSGVLFILADTNSLYSLELDAKEITDTFLDDGVTPDAAQTSYTSSVLLSRFSIETRQKTQAIRENFYMKTVRSKVDGMVDFTITNEERNKTKTIVSKHLALGRKILVGGHSDKVKIGYTTNYDNGCAINALNVEGSMKLRSKNY